MLKIEVRYFATLRREGKKKEILEVKDVVTAAELIESLDIQPEDIAILLVNGIRAELDETIKDGDVVSLFPPVGGG